MISLLEKIANGLPPFSGHAFLVGGCVRDALLGRPPADIDIAVDGNPERIARQTAERLGGRLVVLGRDENSLFRIIGPDTGPLDLTALRGGDIGADLSRRDFTVNAMAWDLRTRRLLDPAGGEADLACGRIHRTDPMVFVQDPVRMARALRFAAELNFHLSPETREEMRRHAPRLSEAPGERIRVELDKLMETGRAHAHLERMVETGLLRALFPVAPPPDLGILARLERQFRCPEPGFPATARAARTASAADRSTLAHAAFLHGWPPNAHPNPLEKLADRLRWSRRKAEAVGRLTTQSRRAEAILAEWGNPTADETISKACAEWLRACGAALPQVLLLTRASFPAYHLPGQTAVERLLNFDRLVLARRRATGPLLTGQDLIRELHLSPSPRFGQLLAAVEAERLSGRLQTREAALERAREELGDSRLPSDRKTDSSARSDRESDLESGP
ncbi:MAG: CCA tRNA nucleotidyltransferase [Thermodesulfobacteriota bacterium]